MTDIVERPVRFAGKVCISRDQRLETELYGLYDRLQAAHEENEALRAENARLREAVIKERETAAMIVEGFSTAMNNPMITAILDGDYEALVDRDFAMAAAIRKGVKDTLADLRAARAAMGESDE